MKIDPVNSLIINLAATQESAAGSGAAPKYPEFLSCEIVRRIPGWEKSLDAVLGEAPRMPVQRVALLDGVGRVLSEDIRAVSDYPSFDRATVDGYACRFKDLAGRLEVIEDIPAGSWRYPKLMSGLCVRVMTGARLPEGADYVIRREDAHVDPSGRIIALADDEADNIAHRAKVMEAGQLVLSAGYIVQTHHIGTLAAAGRTEIEVACAPSVGLLTVGDELAAVGQAPEGPKTADVNSYQVAAMLRAIGASVRLENQLPDDPSRIRRALSQSFDQNDLTIICGGTSEGDRDFTRTVLNGFKSAGTRLLLGRLTVFVKYGGHPCFALPGKSASNFVMAELLVKPFVYQMMGHNYKSRMLTLSVLEPMKRSQCLWDNWAPVRFEGQGVRPLNKNGRRPVLEEVQGIMFYPPHIGQLKEGAQVKVLCLQRDGTPTTRSG